MTRVGIVVVIGIVIEPRVGPDAHAFATMPGSVIVVVIVARSPGDAMPDAGRNRHAERRGEFPHERLDVYHVAQDLAVAVARLTAASPRGYAEIKDQARRSALSTVRHIAEGAGRVTPRDKRARFVIALGEVGELDATLETAMRLELYADRPLFGARDLAHRVGAMLTGLIKRHGTPDAEPAPDPDP